MGANLERFNHAALIRHGRLGRMQRQKAHEDYQKHFAYTIGGSEDADFFELHPQEQYQYRYKFHLSVKAEDLPKAWDAIAPVVVNEGLHAKIVTPETLKEYDDPANLQRGKLITIYADYADDSVPHERDWPKLLTRMMKALKKSGVRPGHKVFDDYVVDVAGMGDILYLRDEYHDRPGEDGGLADFDDDAPFDWAAEEARQLLAKQKQMDEHVVKRTGPAENADCLFARLQINPDEATERYEGERVTAVRKARIAFASSPLTVDEMTPHIGDYCNQRKSGVELMFPPYLSRRVAASLKQAGFIFSDPQSMFDSPDIDDEKNYDHDTTCLRLAASGAKKLQDWQKRAIEHPNAVKLAAPKDAPEMQL